MRLWAALFMHEIKGNETRLGFYYFVINSDKLVFAENNIARG